ncbi:MAG: adenylate kinase, partial [Pseudomonadota bacterium]|nr:adenylate kinase [Pseudomonadota bacterium]
MRIVLLGAPGSGKGTQAKLLAERYRVPHISSGALLREAVAAGTATGKKARKNMFAGELVSDSLVLEFVRERVSRKDARRGVILDGFPRNIPQAQELDGLLGMRGQPVQIALLIETDEQNLLKRITGRRICMKCGAIYNIHFAPPAKEGVCDACRGKLTTRSDDKEATLRNRLQVYREHTAPLMTYYRAQHKLRTVRASGEIP